jgi:hypothetical protein
LSEGAARDEADADHDSAHDFVVAHTASKGSSGSNIDERQILPLQGREGFRRMSHFGHPVQLIVRGSMGGGTNECTLSDLS